MASFRKVPQSDGSVHWMAIIRREGRKTVTKTLPNLSSAKRWARATEIEIAEDNAGLTSEAHRRSIKEVIDRYRREVLPGLRASTQRPYQFHLAWWENEIGALRLADLHPQKIAACRDKLVEAGKSPATVNRYLATLGAVMTAAVQLWHWLPASPLRQVAKQTERNQRSRFLSAAELDSLLAACHRSESPDLLLAVLLAVTTGARQGEIGWLRWRDVDWTRGILNLRQDPDAQTITKGGARSVALVAAVAGLLKARYDAFLARERLSRVPCQDPEGELIFPSRVTRSRPVNLRRPFMTALERAGIVGFHWHDLRHSAASFLAKDGASLVEIGAILGHRSANTTKRYSHLTEAHAHTLTRLMGDKILNPEERGNHE